MIFMKDEGPEEEQARGMTISDHLSGWVWWQLLVYSFVMSQSFMVDETPRKFLLGESVLRQGRGVQRKPIHAFALLQMPTGQNSPHTEMASFGETCPATLQ